MASLKTRLIEQIRLEGPLTIADYMWACLFDPQEGYYATRPALGEDGDFITAPLVSQMFGERLALWAMQAWQDLGAPAKIRVIEIGPGDGTLMSDLTRTFGSLPAFARAVEIGLVEPSMPLRAVQTARLGTVRHYDSLDHIPTDAPLILIANEVLDCLPARQFQRAPEGWFERCVGLHEGELVIGLVPAPKDFQANFEAETGDVCEVSLAQNRLIEAVGALIHDATGAALFIDYGRDRPEPGDTLQALCRHEKTDPLAEPGAHDLTQWADFPSLAVTALNMGLGVSQITPQGVFLQRLGIIERFDELRQKNPDQTDRLARQVHRLISSDEMGDLFKVLALTYPRNLPLAGLAPIGVEA
ncbi:class I SAM-dependent methyltransferase [Asticcacaulis sp. AND118]|uniref:class I SAM-dependent methyltransferase n=1 Tax=Asticcacaulis sp. AND118 TaxID=2840468 RepID=UPI001D000E32|nr:SAM-dependent methyltransferase [Asticcacaulis sp. AND118]UDF02634.1 SAM-dependent methyltransferase [Asticcacaulis sp. AND118]